MEELRRFFAPVVNNGGNSPTEVASNSEMFPGSHDSAIIERQSLQVLRSNCGTTLRKSITPMLSQNSVRP